MISALLLAALAAPCAKGSSANSTDATTSTKTSPAAHPADGPDCELRLALQPDRLGVRAKCNLVFFDAVTEAPRELAELLAEPEEEGHVAAFQAFVLDHLALEVDGRPLDDPVRTGQRVYDAIPSMLDLFPVNGAAAMVQIEVALEYPLAAPPTRLSMVWSSYPPDTAIPGDPPMEVSGQLHDGRVDHPLLFRIDEPEVIWHGEVTDLAERFLPVPEVPQVEPREIPALSLALGCAGLAALVVGVRRSARDLRAGVRPLGLATVLFTGATFGRDVGRVAWPGDDPTGGLDAAEATTVFETLHANVYRAFEYESEDAVYDALARSVSGELLRDLYRQIYTSLILEEEGGAVARVQAVRHLETEIESIGLVGEEDARGFLARTRWQVDGKVTHYGHSHERTTEQVARYTVAEVDGDWRLVGDEILESRVLSAAPDRAEPSR